MRDAFGAETSSDNAASLAALNEAAQLLLGFFADPDAVIGAAIEADPDFIMGRCFRAGMMMLSSELPALAVVRTDLAAIEARAATANARERGHAEALRCWLAGDFPGAGDAYGRVAEAHPRDLIALQFAHQCDFLLGRRDCLRDRPRAMGAHWLRDEDGASFIHGMLAFGLEECGEYAEAEAAAWLSVELNPRDSWGIHAFTHVCEMQGRTGEGAEFLRTRAADWSPGNMFAFHNWWHLALFAMEEGRFADALDLHDRQIRPKKTTAALEMLDSASLLWRLQLHGVDVGDRWRDLADVYEGMVGDAYYPFNDMHAMMALTSCGREDAAQELLSTLEGREPFGEASARMITRVGLPVCKAIRDFSRGNYAAVIAGLQPVQEIAHECGGSHAQRDLLTLTLIEAAGRSGAHDLVARLLAERHRERPESPLCRGLRDRLTGA